MAINLQGDPYNLQGSVPSLQGGNSAGILQPATAPAGFVGPVPTQTTQTVQPAKTNVATPATPQIRDLSGQYGLVNGTVYRKSDNYAFSAAQPFLQEIGAQNFNNLKFDTAYNPTAFQAPQQSFGFMDGSAYNSAGQKVASQPVQTVQQPQPQPAQTPTQNIAQAAGQANLSFDDYMKVVSAQNGLSSAETKAIRDSLGISALEGEVFKTPSKTTEQIYGEVYASSGLSDLKAKIQALDAQIAAKKQQITDATGAINENPFLSEANRVGRVKRLNDQAQADLGNLIDQYNSYQNLYSQGLSEVNNSVLRYSNDFNQSRELNAEKLAYLTSKADQLIKEATGDKVSSASSGLLDYLKAKTQQSNEPSVKSPRSFALENNITQPFYDIGGTIYRTSDGKAYSTPEEFFADGGARDFSNAQKLSAAVKPIELSPGNTLFDPKTGKAIYTAPTAKQLGGGSGGGGGGGSLSAEAQAVLNGTLKLEDLTPTVRGRIAGELNSAGYTRTENLNAGQRESIDAYDTLLREASNAQLLVDKVDTGPLAGKVGSIQSKLGIGNQDFINYSSIISNFSSILLRLRSGAAVTPQEYDRIAGYIPTLTDDEKTAKTKIARFIEETRAAQQNYIKRATQTSQQIANQNPSQGGSNVSLEDLF